MRGTTGLLLTACGLLFSACALAPQAPATATVAATPTPLAGQTEIPPSPTETPIPAPSDTPTATPFVPFTVAIASGDAANLRAGPGYLFLIVKVLPPGTNALLLGRAPGSEWFYIQVNESVNGWVFGKLLKPDEEIFHAPILEPADFGCIHGRVRDENGIPIRGVVFIVIRRSAPDKPANVVVTDSNGEFFSFLPYTGGVWTVTHKGIACESNVWMDPDCMYYKEGYRGIVQPPAADVLLPQTDILEFTWK
jgi:hypothetical protein